MRNITRDELTRLTTRSDVHLFEVLSEQHWAAGHIPGAAPMPLDRVEEVAAARAPDKDAEIVVYCASITCRNSDIAARRLAELGYRRIGVYAGGKADWKDAGLALEVAS